MHLRLYVPITHEVYAVHTSQKVKCVFPSRAGTPGFRASEVLLCSKQQTSAIDVCSVRVIFFSFLTRPYPYFYAESDLHTKLR